MLILEGLLNYNKQQHYTLNELELDFACLFLLSYLLKFIIVSILRVLIEKMCPLFYGVNGCKNHLVFYEVMRLSGNSVGTTLQTTIHKRLPAGEAHEEY